MVTAGADGAGVGDLRGSGAIAVEREGELGRPGYVNGVGAAAQVDLGPAHLETFGRPGLRGSGAEPKGQPSLPAVCCRSDPAGQGSDRSAAGDGIGQR